MEEKFWSGDSERLLLCLKESWVKLPTIAVRACSLQKVNVVAVVKVSGTSLDEYPRCCLFPATLTR